MLFKNRFEDVIYINDTYIFSANAANQLQKTIENTCIEGVIQIENSRLLDDGFTVQDVFRHHFNIVHVPDPFSRHFSYDRVYFNPYYFYAEMIMKQGQHTADTASDVDKDIFPRKRDMVQNELDETMV